MNRQMTVACHCRQVVLQVSGPPIATVECLCSSCRKAGAILATLPGAPQIPDEKGATRFVMYRKDRMSFVNGMDRLKAFRLSSGAGTRRVIATCCNAPVFLEMKGGHWLSLYANLWPADDMPKLEMRTMTGDLDDSENLPGDVPNLQRHSLSFYGRLFGAWVKMGFRNPDIVVEGELDVQGR